MEDKKKEIEEAKEIMKEFKNFEAEAISRNYLRNISITVEDIKAIETLLNYIQELEEKIAKAISYIVLDCNEMKEDPYWKYNKLAQTKQVLYILNPNNKE